MVRTQVAFGMLATVQGSLIAAISLVAVALPAIQRELHLSETQLMLITAGYGLAFAGLLILGGRLSDSYGPRRTFTAGMILFGLASFAGTLATQVGLLVAVRFLQGVGASLAAPAALSLAGALFAEPEHRTQALAVWGGLSATGAVVGMLLSGPIVHWLGWRWVFAPPALVSALALASSPALLPRISPAPASRLDVPGALLMTTGLWALTYGLPAWVDNGGVATLMVTALGVVLLAAFVWVEARVPHPLLPLRLLRGAFRRLALLTILLCAAASAATNFFLSLFLQHVQGLSPLQTSAYFLPMLLIVGTGSLSGRWMGRFGPQRVAAAGLGTGAVSLFLLALWMVGSTVGVDGDTTALRLALWSGLFLFPVGLGLSFSGSAVVALAGVSEQERGLAGGLVNTAMEIGPTIGLAVLVAVSRVKATSVVQAGLSWADATAGGYALALQATSLLFTLLFLAFLAALHRPEAG